MWLWFLTYLHDIECPSLTRACTSWCPVIRAASQSTYGETRTANCRAPFALRRRLSLSRVSKRFIILTSYSTNINGSDIGTGNIVYATLMYSFRCLNNAVLNVPVFYSKNIYFKGKNPLRHTGSIYKANLIFTLRLSITDFLLPHHRYKLKLTYWQNDICV